MGRPDVNLELAWHEAFERYASTVHMGGTPEQRTWAWARANAALDNYTAAKRREDKARARKAASTAKADTQEIPAVVPFPGRSI